MKYFLILISFIFLISCSSPKKSHNTVTSNNDTTITNVVTDSSAISFSNDSLAIITNPIRRVGSEREIPIETAEPVKSTPPVNTKDKPKAKDQAKSKTPTKTVNPLSEYNFGKLVYDIPDTMLLNKNYYLVIRINRSGDTTIFNNINVKMDTSIKVSSEMEVDLIDISNGVNFTIVKSNSTQQIVDMFGYTEWVFNVTPNKVGKLKLNLVVSIMKNGSRKQVVYVEDICVKSTPKITIESFWTKNWQWVFGTVIFPLLIWLYKKLTKKKEDEKEDE